jgi:hypothetical protein
MARSIEAVTLRGIHTARTRWGWAAWLTLLATVSSAAGQETPKSASSGAWGPAVDGLACRLVMAPRYLIGQPLSAVIEVKNTSDKTRYIVPRLDPQAIEYLTLEIVGPKGNVRQAGYGTGYGLGEKSFEPLGPGAIRRFAVGDLRRYFGDLDAWQSYPTRKANDVPTGKYVAKFRFRSPKAPPRFLVSTTEIAGKQVATYKDASPELLAGQWANEATSAPVAFELAGLVADDLIVHEWGVFTVFNEAKYANVNRKDEWGGLPNFFYRQFPKERLRWIPSSWDKPIVYFYAKAALRVSVKVTFPEGAPVVWWPAAASPFDDRPYPGPPSKGRPFRALTWEAWLGDSGPPDVLIAPGQTPPPPIRLPVSKRAEFPLPPDCWLRHARLPDAARLTVIGNIEGTPKIRFPGGKDRYETERFLYYDGLVPTPDYLRCEKADGKSITLRNRAKFDMTRLFVVDRRDKAAVRFAAVGGTLPFKAGTTRAIEPIPVAAADWPAVGVKAVRQALLDAGLFPAETDGLLNIYQKQLLDADGVTAFHILPVAEYNRMLPLSVFPSPAVAPVRVGIALHPHVEIEPVLAGRVATLLRQLDDVDFETRDTAGKLLLEIGPMAIGMLRAELQKGPTLETRRRIESVLDRVDGANWLNVPANSTAKKSGAKK